MKNIKDIMHIFKYLINEHRSGIFTLFKDCYINYFRYGLIGNSLRIDASNICQLQCPGCFRSRDNDKIPKKTYLKFKDFRSLIDNNPTFKNIELSDNGEIFLNPELKDIIIYAHKKKLNLTARNGVNLNAVSEDILESLVKYKFRVILVSIDGANNNTYSIYRRGGNFDNVIKNIEIINYYKIRH